MRVLMTSLLLAIAVVACARDPRLERSAVLAGIATPPAPRQAGAVGIQDPAIPPGVELEDGVDPDEAVALALWNHAAFQEALAALGFARADLAQAGMLTNPTFSILFPLGPKQLEFAATLPLEALWLRPRRVAIAQLDGARIAENLVQSGLDLVRDVGISTAEVELAQRRTQLADESLALRAEIAEIAAHRLAAGDASELESAAARVDALRARDERDRAGLDAELALARWQALLGLGREPTPLAPTATAGAARSCEGDLDRLLAEGEAARPDLRATELGIEAAGRRMGLATAQIFALSAVYDANGKGTQGFESGPGVALAIPILDQNQAGRTRARAQLDQALASHRRVVEAIHLEIRTADARRREAEQAWRAWRTEVLPSLADAVAANEHALAAGEVSELAVLTARQALVVGRGREAELGAELRRACAELEHGVGRRWRPDPALRLARELP